MQSPEKKPAVPPIIEFSLFTTNIVEEEFHVRDKNNVKLQAADLFSLFTADIIKENVPFTR